MTFCKFYSVIKHFLHLRTPLPNSGDSNLLKNLVFEKNYFFEFFEFFEVSQSYNLASILAFSKNSGISPFYLFYVILHNNVYREPTISVNAARIPIWEHNKLSRIETLKLHWFLMFCKFYSVIKHFLHLRTPLPNSENSNLLKNFVFEKKFFSNFSKFLKPITLPQY